MCRVLSISVALFYVAVPSFGQADCAPNMTTLLSCTAKSGDKALDLCTDGRHVLYRYGNADASPELELIQSVIEVDHTPWSGLGSSIWESVTVTNGDFSYEVHSSISRDPSNPEVSGGVEVFRGSDPLASVTCDAGSTTTQIDALFTLREAAGLCYDYSSHAWSDCPN